LFGFGNCAFPAIPQRVPPTFPYPLHTSPPARAGSPLPASKLYIFPPERYTNGVSSKCRGATSDTPPGCHCHPCTHRQGPPHPGSGWVKGFGRHPSGARSPPLGGSVATPKGISRHPLGDPSEPLRGRHLVQSRSSGGPRAEAGWSPRGTLSMGEGVRSPPLGGSAATP
jgi:hypothetical protein